MISVDTHIPWRWGVGGGGSVGGWWGWGEGGWVEGGYQKTSSFYVFFMIYL